MFGYLKVKQQPLKGNLKEMLLSFADVQHTATGDVALCMDEDVQKGILAILLCITVAIPVYC